MEPKAHREISKKAVEIYNKIYSLKSARDKELADRFIDGSVKEDDKTPQRAFNWHFYDPENRLGRTWWGANKSNEKRVDKLIKKLVESVERNLQNTYEIAGRLAHHIQDMSSPPHVVPIFHGTNDPFDKYATAKIANINLSSEQLNAANSESRELKYADLKTLWKDAAEQTIARLYKEPAIFDGRKIAEDWSEFWHKAPNKGFGCYGTYVFGVESKPFTKAIYDSLYKEQITSAIEDSLRLLVMLRKKLIAKQ